MERIIELICIIAAVFFIFSPLAQRFARRAGSSTLELRGEIRALLGIALPLTLVRVSQALNQAVDTAVAGRLSPEELTGAALGTLVFWTVSGALMPVLQSASPKIAQARVRSRQALVWTTLVSSLWASLLLALLCTLITLVILVFGILPKIAVDYLSGILPGIPAIFAFGSLRYSLTAMNRQRFMVVMSIVGLAVNAGADCALAFGWGGGGIPRLGVSGIGYATTITHWVVVLALLIYLGWVNQETSRQRQEYGWKPMPALIRFILVKGWAIGAVALIEVSFFAIIGAIMARLNAIAAHTVANDLVYFVFMFSSSLGQAVAIRLAANSRRYILNITIAIVCAYVALVNVIVQFSPTTLVGLFLHVNDPAFAGVVYQSVVLLRIAGVLCLFDGVQIVLVGGCRAFNDNNVAFAITTFCYLAVGCVSGFLLGNILGYYGVWIGVTAGLAAATVGLYLRVQRHLNG
jgi:multidrug resistance protein, MATE family